MTTGSDLHGHGVPTPQATVHFCSPANDHALHRQIGMGRTPGWFLMTVNGCVADIKRFDTEPEAQAVADEWMAVTMADRKARGL